MSTTPSAGADLLDAIAARIARFVALDAHQTTAVTLWTAATHAADAFDIAPYLSVTSAEKQSGKTTLVRVLRELVRDPLSTTNVTPAALFRSIEERHPTLLVDEADAIFTKGPTTERAEELRGILNAGFERGGDRVLRCEGPSQKVAEFDVFGPKLLAGIGDPPDTIADRSIRIRMRRKHPGRSVERARARRVRNEHSAALRERCAEWVADVEVILAGFELEDLPINDRANDLWEPLCAVAAAAAGRWPAAARAAALALSGEAAAAEQSTGVRLLGDLRDLCAAAPGHHLRSVDLCEQLNDLEESPWGGWNAGTGITPRDLARRLRAYDIAPSTVRTGDRTAKGYARDRLEDAFARYLPATIPAATTGSVTDDVTACDGKCYGQEPHNHAGCDGVTLVTAPPGGAVDPDDLERWTGLAAGGAA